MLLLRDIRKQKNVTLKEVSEATGYTKSYISQLERGIKQPSLESLKRICAYLDIPVSNAIAVFGGGEKELPETFAVRACMSTDPAERYENCGPDVTVKRLSPDRSKPGIRAYKVTLPAGITLNEDRTGHPYEEMLYVLSGTVEIYTDAGGYTLSCGDSLYIRPEVSHNVRNTGNGSAELLFTFNY